MCFVIIQIICANAYALERSIKLPPVKVSFASSMYFMIKIVPVM